jgi:hypothetical protein
MIALKGPATRMFLDYTISHLYDFLNSYYLYKEMSCHYRCCRDF